MKSNFDKCLEMLLKHEGGFVNNKFDNGGMTNLGITKSVYDAWIGRESTEQEMRSLTVEDVSPIYKKNYWKRIKGSQLPSGVDWSVFDWAVNSGCRRPSRALQRAIGAEADGIIGTRTLLLVHTQGIPKDIIYHIHNERQAFYESLDDFKHFGRGWTRRNKETLEQALSML